MSEKNMKVVLTKEDLANNYPDYEVIESKKLPYEYAWKVREKELSRIVMLYNLKILVAPFVVVGIICSCLFYFFQGVLPEIVWNLFFVLIVYVLGMTTYVSVRKHNFIKGIAVGKHRSAGDKGKCFVTVAIDEPSKQIVYEVPTTYAIYEAIDYNSKVAVVNVAFFTRVFRWFDEDNH